MRRKVAVLALAMGLVLATVATAKDKVFADSKDYLESSAAMKLNRGAYDKMIEVKNWAGTAFWVWCEKGYDLTKDPDLSLGDVSYAAPTNPLVTDEIQAQQLETAKVTVLRFLREKGIQLKESGGKRVMEYAIVRNERYVAEVVIYWRYVCEVRVMDENHRVVFRAVLRHETGEGWQDSTLRWSKAFADLVASNGKRFAKGFGIDAVTTTAPTSTTKGTETEKPKDDHAPDF